MLQARDGSWVCPSCEPQKARAAQRIRPAGRERSFAAVVLLTVVTLGIYFLYYQYVVFRDVDHAAGRPHHWPLFAGHATLLALFLAIGIWIVLSTPSEAWDAFSIPPWLRAFAMASALFHASYLFLEIRRFKGPWQAPMQSAWLLPILVLLQAALGPIRSENLGADGLSLILFIIQIILFWKMNKSINTWWREHWSGQADDCPETEPRTASA
jgi:hypothetical protein